MQYSRMFLHSILEKEQKKKPKLCACVCFCFAFYSYGRSSSALQSSELNTGGVVPV